MTGKPRRNTVLNKVLDWFSLNRDVSIMIMTVLLMTLGAQLWEGYVPKYIEYLGAGGIVVGLYGSIKQFVNAVYQYPGGALTDRLGSMNALVIFLIVSIFGYIIYYISPSWELFIVGTFLVLVWDSMSQPAIFTLIREALPKSKRAMGFSIQSILRRIPIALSPPIGGYLILSVGLERGIKIGFTISMIMGLLGMVLQKKFYQIKKKEEISESPIITGPLWRNMVLDLKRLLTADILARVAGYMVEVYVVLYVLNILKASPVQYGFMVSIQMTTSVLCYLPAAKLADIYGRRIFIAATFLFFALFPVTLILIPEASLLPLAFTILGLREIGEPARKALIVDLAGDKYAGKMIGLYYSIRELANIPAPIIGGILWSVSPQLPFYLASVIGAGGVVLFSLSMPIRSSQGPK